ncbi:MAG TPA: tetratricopeptide repeat protein, partial [Bryobacteraceae bacterium]|nr:tetratricopeptide repeat protein [Bryobacteraceae bacterium]
MVCSILFPRVALRIAVVSALCCAVPGFSQAPAPAPAPAPGPGGTPGGTPGGGGRPSPGGDRPPMPGTQQPGRQDQNMDFERARPVFLSGKVVLDDGSRPPVGVLIERVCGGTIRPEGYTDTKGNFSFQLGQNQHMMVDASNGGPMGGMGMGRSSTGMGGMGMGSMTDLNGCEIRANLPGFRSDVVMLAGRRAMDNPDVGTIILHRLAKVEGFTFSGTSLDAPKEATKAYEKGSQAAKKKKWKDAEEQLRKAVDLYPKYAVAWYELGTVYHQQNNV